MLGVKQPVGSGTRDEALGGGVEALGRGVKHLSPPCSFFPLGNTGRVHSVDLSSFFHLGPIRQPSPPTRLAAHPATSRARHPARPPCRVPRHPSAACTLATTTTTTVAAATARRCADLS
ncbi:hypothetical protein E2C01_091051 [Portunus trituberculatus]|uniref:Uncharacterized protein n=1 Tax=Portunus trituberculatus TaxID=210409 RepID=A0A5B7JN11_PORTR|nr:hypothetical protein [Portunus trituberculatus]